MLCSVDTKFLKLTPYDDIIYTTFRQDFPKFDVKHLDEQAIKSDDSKTKWRSFIEKFNKLEDFSYGTLIRVDSDSDFSPDNSMLVIRVQFWAIEIARNREGLNDNIRKTYKPAPKQENEAETQEISA
jgi:Polysaccharide biosynthesis